MTTATVRINDETLRSLEGIHLTVERVKDLLAEWLTDEKRVVLQQQLDDLECLIFMARTEDVPFDRRLNGPRDHEPVDPIALLHKTRERGLLRDIRDDAASLGGAAHEAHGFNVKAESTRRGLLSAHANEHTEDRP